MEIQLLKNGDKVTINGYTDELWIKDYHTRVSTTATAMEDENPKAKKLLVTLDEIDGDRLVTVSVNKKYIQRM
jgi:hypothetical protein